MEEELSKRERKKLNKQNVQPDADKPKLQSKLITVGVIVALAIGLFWFFYRNGNTSSSDTETPSPLSVNEVSPTDHTKGPEDAIVTLLEYGDFQCPACASYQPVVEQLVAEFPDNLRVVSRHFPLRTIHKHAQISSQAAEAAADQGKFWEMSALLYQKQNDWINARDPRNLFKEYAEELSLDVEQFDNYMNSSEAKAKVDADFNSGLSAGIDSTPTFFINGTRIANPRSYDEFSQLIKQLIDEGLQADETDTPQEGTPEGEITPQL